MLKALLPLCAALMLSACQSDRKLSQPPMPLPKPPAESVEPCDALPVMFATAGEAVAWVDAVSSLYVACDSKRRELVDAWPK